MADQKSFWESVVDCIGNKVFDGGCIGEDIWGLIGKVIEYTIGGIYGTNAGIFD